ncbi:MAG: UDP-N-acetylmuramoyl-tripeptide--D-alanyl-D-alanine ligase [Armatimonadota bacterium]|nr:UDP-N-acetylmuramoyl-tripeptide--D-alanyl-D-alanine ligase [Armatimonadota bacterium]
MVLATTPRVRRANKEMLNTKLAEILLILNGRLLRGETDAAITGVSADSRLAKPGDLFFALVAERDGHDFIDAAARAGASAAIVSKEVEASIPLVIVPDTLLALGNLAKLLRLRQSVHVIGVTGSVGKTTTKEMIAAVLDRKYCVLKSEGNYNNEIGLPMTLFQLRPEHDVVALEMAMRGPGEIRRLADIARPRIGVITNVGLSHVERLGSIDAIAAAKAEILDELPPDGLAVLPADDQFYRFLRSRRFGRVATFGTSESADVRASDIRIHPDGSPGATVTTKKGVMELELAAIGEHNIWNALAAIAVAIEMGVDLDDARAALEVFGSPSMRLNVVRSPLGYTVINDTYNANPASMAAAVRSLAAMQGDRKIAVLGDMLELGDHADSEHAEIGALLAEQGVDMLITVGELGRRIADGAVSSGFPASEITSLGNSSEVSDVLRPELRPGDVVLVKGSRAVKMEIVVEGILSV